MPGPRASEEDTRPNANVEQPRAAALAEVARLLAQSLDPDVVGQRIAESIRGLLAAQSAVLFREDPGSGDLVSLAVSGELGPLSSPAFVHPRGSGAAGLAMQEHRPVVTPNVLNDPHIRLAPEVRSRIAEAPFRAVLAVPLCVQDRVVGALAVGDREGRVFGADEVRLAQAFADQAAMALENARLFVESERRRRAAESLAEVGRMLSRSLDLEEVAQQITDSVCGLLGAVGAAVYEVEPDSGERVVVAVTGAPEHGLVRGIRVPAGTGAVGQAVRDRRVVATRDILTDPGIPLTAEMRARIEQVPYRAVLALPLIVGQRVIGALGIAAPSGRIFTAEEVALISAFGDQAGMALHNARLYAVIRTRLGEAETLLAVGQALSLPLPLEEALRRVVREVVRAVGADTGGTYILDAERGALLPLAGYRVPKDALDALGRTMIPVFASPAFAEACATGRPLWTSCYPSDPRFYQESLSALRPRSLWVVPTRVRGEVVGGMVLAWWDAERTPTPAEFRLAEAIASQVALALERRRHEEALRENQRVLSTLLANLPGMAYRRRNDRQWTNRLTSEGCFDLTGYRPGDLVGNRLVAYGQLIHPEDRDRVWEEVQAAVREKVAFQLVYRIRTASGDERWVWEKGQGVFSSDGELLALEGFITDISERKRAEEALREREEQLRQAQKLEAVGRLAGGVAHDFNNLLTVIMGRSQILLGRLGPDDPLRRHVELVQQTGNRAAALTQQLLAFSRKQTIRPRVLDLGAVITGMEEMLARLIGEHIELGTRLQPGLGRVVADPGQVEQVILNLAVNARDAMPEGGRLTVETADVELGPGFVRAHPGATPGRHVMLAVSDTGVGMDAEMQAHVFEPFFTTKGPGKGTGLGLATVYGIVKQSGGSIWVESAPGRGTTFRIYLPRVDAPAEEDGAGRSVATDGSETILLVEDEDDVRDLAQEILEGRGFRVLAARQPTDALLVAERHPGPIDLLVTDVVMPQMNGRELADRLRGVRPAIRVLFMSGYTAEALGRHGVLDRATALLYKPFTPQALAAKVRDTLDRG